MKLSCVMCIVVGCFGLLVLSSSGTGDPKTPAIDTPPSVSPMAMYDTIATDLSDYIFPTDAFRKLTSTFAEFRRTHFHGGVDIGTGNTTGYRVFAMRDGYVSRIRISPHGYGKMLYVRHADGYYTTYAHLERFNAELDARAEREQRIQECYPVDIECTPDEFPVRKGDIIAYTGETGVGTPHLHFEIRDENYNFINPLLCEQININDNIPPAIRALALRPLGEESTLQGDWNPRVYKAHPSRERNRFIIREPIQVTGAFGFAIDARDLSNGSNFKHGVYSHELFLNDSLVYTVKLDRAPSEDAHQIGLYYDWDLMPRGRFEKLYSASPNALPFYTPRVPDAGILRTTSHHEGKHEFRIVTTDFNNNHSEVTGTLIFNHAPSFDIMEMEEEFTIRTDDAASIRKYLLYTKKNRDQQWSLKTVYTDPIGDKGGVTLPLPAGKYDVLKVIAENHWGTMSRPKIMFFNKPSGPAGKASLKYEHEADFVRITTQATGMFTETPTVMVFEGEHQRTLTLTAIDIDHYAGSFRPREDYAGTRRLVMAAEVNGIEARAIAEFDLYPVIAGQEGIISLDNDNLRIEYQPNSVFKTLFLRVEKQPDDGNNVYVMRPENAVLNKGLTVSVNAPAGRRKQALFANIMGRDELLAHNADRTGGFLTGRMTRRLGDLYLAEDNTPPYISGLSVSVNSARKPSVSFRYGDNASGVDYQELKMYIGGVVAVPEIDGEHRRVSYRASEPLERGSHLLTIRIKDRLGNSAEVERRFTVR